MRLRAGDGVGPRRPIARIAREKRRERAECVRVVRRETLDPGKAAHVNADSADARRQLA
jgi:hypothetical protein